MSFILTETLTGFEQQDKVIVGVVSDTHVPDRVDRLHDELLAKLKDYQVNLILHAGDICVPSVLDLFETVAPVIAVRGNRDIYFLNSLPMARKLTIAGHNLALLHGHGRWRHYFFNKVRMFLKGYHLGLFLPTLLETVPDTDVIVFGHTHRALNSWYNNTRLLFNPGPCSTVLQPDFPSFGIIRLEKNTRAAGEIIELKRARIKNRRWVKEKSNS